MDGMDRKGIVPGLTSLSRTLSHKVNDGSCLGQAVAECRAFFLEKLNILLVALPFAFISRFVGWGDAATFVLSCLALTPLAERLGFVTEQLAMYTSDAVGGLLNATFGNATEVIIAAFALSKGGITYLRVVQLSLLGSVVSNLLLVMGTAFIAGGIKRKVQTFNRTGINVNGGMLILSTFAIMLSSLLDATHTERRDSHSELQLSRFMSIFMIICYGIYLFFQLKTHKHLFEAEEDEEAPAPPLTAAAAAAALEGGGAHADAISRTSLTGVAISGGGGAYGLPADHHADAPFPAGSGGGNGPDLDSPSGPYLAPGQPGGTELEMGLVRGGGSGSKRVDIERQPLVGGLSSTSLRAREGRTVSGRSNASTSRGGGDDAGPGGGGSGLTAGLRADADGDSGGGGSGGGDDEEELLLSKVGCFVWLTVVTVFIAFLSEFITDAIKGASTGLGVPLPFLTTIVLPIVGNAAEHASAIVFAFKNRMEIALGVAVGSSTQVGMMVVPFCVLLAWAMGQPLDLDFNAFEAFVLFASVLLAVIVLQDGQSNYLKGVLLVLTYFFISAAFWCHKDVNLTSLE